MSSAALAFFREVFFDVAKSYPDIDSDAVYVDAMSLYMVQNPWDFDVLVMENQFGDILSDLGAGLVGGLGLGPSAEIGEEHGLFQPSHGTAPQIAGKNVANPLATILSAAMMLDWLGDKHDDSVCIEAAIALEKAVAQVLSEGDIRTPDIGGDLRRPMSPMRSRMHSLPSAFSADHASVKTKRSPNTFPTHPLIPSQLRLIMQRSASNTFGIPSGQCCEAFEITFVQRFEGSRSRQTSVVRTSMPEFWRIRLQKCLTALPSGAARCCLFDSRVRAAADRR